MKKIVFILLFIPVFTQAQLVSLVVRNDTVFGFNPSTEVYTQYTKLVPPMESGKMISNNGTAYLWVSGALQGSLDDSAAALRASKQDVLVSGSNIKTINGTTVLGSGNITMGAGLGYTLSVQALTSSLADAQTVYFGQLPKAPITTANVSKVYIRKAGTIKIANIYAYSGTAGTSEAWVMNIRLNNTTDTQIASVAAATNERIWSNTGLNIAVVVGDYIEIKSTNPAWATNPLTTILSGYIYIE